MTLRDPSDTPRRNPPEYRVSQTPRAPGWIWLEIIAGMGEIVTTCMIRESEVAAEVAIAIGRHVEALKAGGDVG
ncbi:MAG TPA: hypothetical protein VKG78_01410 [Opitutaceae bacterium]|nr:hypothetical protein [Opitutaceae bacterium]